MNLPNKLSVARVLCIPAIVALLHIPVPACRLTAAALFILGCLTDFFDGRIARKQNLVTDFGRFIDPVADKLLVLTTLIMLVYLNLMPAWIVIVILCRELSVDGLRMVAVTKGHVIAAGPLGKWKTACQMIFTIIIMFMCEMGEHFENIAAVTPLISEILLWITAALALISGIIYIKDSRKYIDYSK